MATRKRRFWNEGGIKGLGLDDPPSPTPAPLAGQMLPGPSIATDPPLKEKHMPPTPIDLLALCREASRFAPLMPSAQRALHDALTLLTFHFGGDVTFYEDNRENAGIAAGVLTAWVERRKENAQPPLGPTEQG